jgi:hypothetical protein
VGPGFGGRLRSLELLDQDALFSQLLLLLLELILHLLQRGLQILIMCNKGLPDDQQAREDEGDK